MTAFTRYAIYYAPEPGPLADFTARWLGWDAASGTRRDHPDLPGLPRPVSKITAQPRKYGFHGTLKPPFALAAGSSRGQLEDDLGTLANRLAPVTLDGLSLARLGGFLALVPDGDSNALAALAAACVRALDRHRAALSDAALARRRGAGLTPAQDENLVRWGYPYVMDEFRFHLTLTGRLPRAESEAVEKVLAPLLAPRLPRPFVVRQLCLFGEALDGFFHILSRHPLRG